MFLHQRRAFTLVEVLIDVTIISLIGIGLLSSFAAALKSIQASKATMTAAAIANERMEIIRNLPYDSIATTTGSVPPGQIPSHEEMVRDGLNFSIDTLIIYVDDPSDGLLGGNPPDPFFSYDYKKVEIRVKRINSSVNLVVLTTNIAANAAETSTNKGILYFCAVDSANQPISGATVTIQNDDVSPEVNLSVETGASGCVMVPELPPDSHNNYHIVLTKMGYSTSQTYPWTPQNPNQLHPDIDIIAQQVTNVTMMIDLVSSITINAYDLNGTPIPNLSIHLQDDYELYHQGNDKYFRYSEDLQLDNNGNLVVSGLATANYTFSINTPNYYISSANLESPFNLPPDTDLVYNLFLTTSSTAPRIFSAVPNQGIQDAITITINGENFDAPNPIIKLINPGSGIEVAATSVVVHSSTQASGIFDLTNAETGLWNIFIQNEDGEFSRKVGGFEVVSQ